ncbi:High temperature protein G [Megamonas hypermegale]|uniref:Chaperone protein HtpG n=1 Tax=Megamonas hypermegale TaxID=158847 RepID=A0A239T7G3_9FIRM|nr:molecular chaperone HtpG [Megamonas hypermegale]SNU93661.1 High temperature protein G [Megamonas hypermegale]
MAKETHQFQAETKKLLDLMIHSIYTNREIFLRELISNASDAIDKVHFEGLTNKDLLEGDDQYEIFLVPDADSHTLTISDNGLGMNKDDLMENLGTIAKSGTKAFLEKLQQAKEGGDTGKDLIGQFGVGFYSAFMVSEKITVVSRKAGEKQAYKWESTADGSYTIEECEKEKRGTSITLTLLPEFYGDKAEENFTDTYKLQSLVKKYSDYVRYPIKMNFVVEEQPKDADGKPIEGAGTIKRNEVRTLNSMQPLWAKNKSEIKPEEYDEFYQNLFHDWERPMEVMHNKVEGTIEYTSLLFFPEHAPYNLYHSDYEPGLQLYSRHVFIMDKCKDLLPEYLRFVKGLVDSPDFSLNISRELLQQSRELKLIGKNLEKSILRQLNTMLKKDREKYEKFWAQYGKSLKIGIYGSAYTGTDTVDKLKDLLLFTTSKEDKLITLKEYVEHMPENQKKIYYATGKDRAAIDSLPQMELLRDKGIEVLYFLDNVDEFAVEVMREYDGKPFHSISRGDLGLDDVESQEVKKETENITKTNEDLIKDIKETLGDKVADVKISSRLKSSAVCLVADEQGPSFAMEQVFAETNNPMFKAKRILEINPKHDLFARLQNIHEAGKDTQQFKDYCNLLYAQALLIEGMMPEDPAAIANKIAELMAK